MKITTNGKLDEAFFLWLVQKRNLGNPILGHILCEQALIFNIISCIFSYKKKHLNSCSLHIFNLVWIMRTPTVPIGADNRRSIHCTHILRYLSRSEILKLTFE